MHQLDAGNDGGGIAEPFEPEHDIDSGLDVSMILLDHVVEVLGGSKLGVARQQSIALHFSHRSMGGGITVQSNGFWGTALARDCLPEEGLGCRYVSLGTEPEINGPPGPIYGPVQVPPLASNFHVSLIDPPRLTRREPKTIPALDELRSIMLYPSQNRRVS